MKARFLIIGLGQFGAAMAEELVSRGRDVTAVDIRQERVDALSNTVHRAIVLDATDESALRELRVESFDAVLNCMGDESIEGSILTTALLRQFGARRIIARATTRLHGRILRTIGVDDVVHPESQVAQHLAIRLASPALVNVFDFGDGANVAEVETPEEWVGRSLADLDLRRRYGVTVVGLRRSTEGSVRQLEPSPRADVPLAAGEVLLILGRERELAKMMRECL